MIDFDEDISVVEDLKDATSSCEQGSNSSNSKENTKTLKEIMYPDLCMLSRKDENLLKCRRWNNEAQKEWFKKNRNTVCNHCHRFG